jgi:hypothetical protein
MIDRLVMLAAAFAGGVGMAQQPSTVDLASPVWRQHANLPLNNAPGPALLQSLQPLVDDQVRKGNPGKTVYTSVHDEDTGFAPYPSLTSLYRDLSCRADVVLMGRVHSSMAHLSASGGAIYSDYDFEVDSVLKDNPLATVAQTRHLLITRPGGLLAVTGGSVQYENQAMLALRPGKTFLLFLRKIPETGGYEAAPAQNHSYVFSALVLEASQMQWRVFRGAYMGRDYTDLANGVLESTIRLASTTCN